MFASNASSASCLARSEMESKRRSSLSFLQNSTRIFFPYMFSRKRNMFVSSVSSLIPYVGRCPMFIIPLCIWISPSTLTFTAYTPPTGIIFCGSISRFAVGSSFLHDNLLLQFPQHYSDDQDIQLLHLLCLLQEVP